MEELNQLAQAIEVAQSGTPAWVETIGYTAMVLVAISIMMNNMKLLRILNMAGAIVFIVYGLLIVSWPVVILNAFLALVNFYYLFKKGK